MEIASLEKTIDDKVKNKMNEAQRAYYLKEKISVMKEELGDFSQDDDVIEIVDRLKNTELPKEVGFPHHKASRRCFQPPPPGAFLNRPAAAMPRSRPEIGRAHV